MSQRLTQSRAELKSKRISKFESSFRIDPQITRQKVPSYLPDEIKFQEIINTDFTVEKQMKDEAEKMKSNLSKNLFLLLMRFLCLMYILHRRSKNKSPCRYRD